MVDAWSGLKEMATGKYKGATSAVAVTKAQKTANARMVEALAKTPDNKALASLFAESIISGSPVAGAVYGDFLQQLGEENEDRAETFNEAVGEAWAEKAGWDGEMSDFTRGLFNAAGLGAYLPEGYADSWAHRRERAAHLIDEAKKRGITDPILEHIEKALDKDHKHAVRMFDTFYLDPPIGKGPK